MQQENTDLWVSFCISTYKRPSFLEQQLALLLHQVDPHFEIIVSDNDPLGSARTVVEATHDQRVRYFHNEDNLGMINSFNKSIERAKTPYVVMVTDDDPIDRDFLSSLRPLIEKYPGYSLYGGFSRANRKIEELEKIGKEKFLEELLIPEKTLSLLWSSCILNRGDVLSVGCIPDFGSPHLADHALLAMVGSQRGAVIVNKMYSRLNLHDQNFSKFNFDYYVKGCKGFYSTLTAFSEKDGNCREKEEAIISHLGKWFIANIYVLKRYYTLNKDKEMLWQVNHCAEEILEFSFMKRYRLLYRFKKYAFRVKKFLGILK